LKEKRFYFLNWALIKKHAAKCAFFTISAGFSYFFVAPFHAHSEILIAGSFIFRQFLTSIPIYKKCMRGYEVTHFIQFTNKRECKNCHKKKFNKFFFNSKTSKLILFTPKILFKSLAKPAYQVEVKFKLMWKLFELKMHI
jgi:hypothetical protein